MFRVDEVSVFRELQVGALSFSIYTGNGKERVRDAVFAYVANIECSSKNLSNGGDLVLSISVHLFPNS